MILRRKKNYEDNMIVMTVFPLISHYDHIPLNLKGIRKKKKFSQSVLAWGPGPHDENICLRGDDVVTGALLRCCVCLHPHCTTVVRL